MLTAIVVMAALADGNPGVPPTDAEVIRALPRVARGLPHVYEEYRNNIVIVKNRLERSTFAVPLFDGLTVVKERWECAVSFDRIIATNVPFPIQIQKPQVSVVYIDEVTAVK